MTLGFSTQIKGKPTYFAEKIIRSLDISEPKKMTNYDLLAEIQKENEQLNIHEFQELRPKIHTIREDKRNRWKVGNDIHFVINDRTKNRFQFAPVLKVKSVQEVEIVYSKENIIIKIDGLIYCGFGDGMECYEDDIIQFVRNDGFESVKNFFDFFDKDFKGKIIHWTNYSY